MRLYLLEEGVEDAVDPGSWFIYEGKKYPAWGSTSGRMRTQDYELAKFNRYIKVGEMADDLEKLLRETVESDPSSMEARSAYACLLMMQHGIRVGNETSAEGYISSEGEKVKTFGVSTLLNDHVDFKNDTLHLHFLGKAEVEHRIKVVDPFIKKWGMYYYKNQNKFDTWIGIDYDTLFNFVTDTLGEGFKPKDFRTFRGNIAAWNYIGSRITKGKKVDTATEANDIIKLMVEHTASILGNTPGVTKSNYLDSRMVDWIKAMLLKNSK